MDDETPKDIALLGPPSPDGSIPAVRVGCDRVSVGVFRPAKPGSSLAGREVVSLRATGGGLAHEVDVLYDGRSGHAGPAMVNSREFRSGWDAVFGGPAVGSGAAN